MTAAPSAAERLAAPGLSLVRRWREFQQQTWLRRRPEPRFHTPSRVVCEEPAWRLREFESLSGSARHPVLIVPPEVNHSAICDFGPGQSLVDAVRRAGFSRVAALEWRSATAETAERDIDDSIVAIQQAVARLGAPVHLIGLCQGGWESAIATALEPVQAASLTLVAAPIDFHAGLGAIRFLSAGMPLAAYQALVAAGGGVMRGEWISAGFDNLLPLERYGLKALAVWNHLEEADWMERFQRLEDWYRAPKDLPGRMYLRAVRELFKENRLIEGRLEVLGRRVDLGRIRCPLALVAGRRDHITPTPQLFAARGAVASRQVLAVELDAGHVGTFMGAAALRERWPGILGWILAREPTPPPEEA